MFVRNALYCETRIIEGIERAVSSTLAVSSNAPALK